MTRAILRWLLAAFMMAAGAIHFRAPALYAAMMPGWLPRPSLLSAVAGAREVLGGAGLLVPRLRKAAGWGLIALLVAVFPANLHVALEGRMPGFAFSPATLWIRLPLQGVLIGWAAWVSVLDGRGPAR